MFDTKFRQFPPRPELPAVPEDHEAAEGIASIVTEYDTERLQREAQLGSDGIFARLFGQFLVRLDDRSVADIIKERLTVEA